VGNRTREVSGSLPCLGPINISINEGWRHLQSSSVILDCDAMISICLMGSTPIVEGYCQLRVELYRFGIIANRSLVITFGLFCVSSIVVGHGKFGHQLNRTVKVGDRGIQFALLQSNHATVEIGFYISRFKLN